MTLDHSPSSTAVSETEHLTRGSDATSFNGTTMRSIVEKSVELLESRCIRLNGRDPNWRGLFGEQLDVNSFHHQAVDEPGDGVAVVGSSSDGVIEAIEMPGRKVLGVQWHPELYRAEDPAFDWIVSAAASSRRRPGCRDTEDVALAS